MLSSWCMQAGFLHSMDNRQPAYAVLAIVFYVSSLLVSCSSFSSLSSSSQTCFAFPCFHSQVYIWHIVTIPSSSSENMRYLFMHGWAHFFAVCVEGSWFSRAKAVHAYGRETEKTAKEKKQNRQKSASYCCLRFLFVIFCSSLVIVCCLVYRFFSNISLEDATYHYTCIYTHIDLSYAHLVVSTDFLNIHTQPYTHTHAWIYIHTWLHG